MKGQDSIGHLENEIQFQREGMLAGLRHKKPKPFTTEDTGFHRVDYLCCLAVST
jgi:hypothetical protein